MKIEGIQAISVVFRVKLVRYMKKYIVHQNWMDIQTKKTHIKNRYHVITYTIIIKISVLKR